MLSEALSEPFCAVLQFVFRFHVHFSFTGVICPQLSTAPPICADRISFDLDFARWELPAEVDSDRVWFTLDQDGNLAEI